MKRLMRTTNIYSCDSEQEAQEIIKEDSEIGELVKKTIETKTKKAKGEIVASCLKVTTTIDIETEWFESIGGAE